MCNKKILLSLISQELNQFNSQRIKNLKEIVPSSIPILWFGDFEKYCLSPKKIITVSLNPSDNEFKLNKTGRYQTIHRFPSYNGSLISLYTSYNEYFNKKPYNKWFKSSFGSVLASFNASHYNDNGFTNTALHTDIGSPYATSPSWSGLSPAVKQILEPRGSATWHNLIRILEPDVILFSASNSFQNKISFPQVGKWNAINVNAKRPLLVGKFQINKTKFTSVLFQVQGRQPFLQTSKAEKLKFKNYI